MGQEEVLSEQWALRQEGLAFVLEEVAPGLAAEPGTLTGSHYFVDLPGASVATLLAERMLSAEVAKGLSGRTTR